MAAEPTATSIPRAERQQPVRTVQIRQIDSSELFARGSEVIINHDGAAYRLRRTSNGKLLLTK